MAGRGKANAVDATVGNRLRVRRTALGMSQEELGRRLGLTFQQVQKFESGTNRISASYLFEITQALKVSVSYFFDEVGRTRRGTELPDSVERFLMTAEGLSLWRAFARLDNDTIRQRIVALVKAIAGEHQLSRSTQ